MKRALAKTERDRESIKVTIPKSYVLAKVLFKKRCYGVSWVFAEIMKVHTTIAADADLAK